MKENQKKIVGYVFLGLAAVALVLVIVGLCIPNVAGTYAGVKLEYKLFGDEHKVIDALYKSSPTLSIVGFVVAIVGIAAVLAYFVLKLFLNKNIKAIGLLGGIVAAVGGILAFVNAAIIAGKLNTGNGNLPGNLQAYDPAVGAILGLTGGLLVLVLGAFGSSKKLN